MFTSKLNWNTHFKTIVCYVECNLAPQGCFRAVSRTLPIPAPTLSPLAPSLPSPYLHIRKQSTPSLGFVLVAARLKRERRGGGRTRGHCQEFSRLARLNQTILNKEEINTKEDDFLVENQPKNFAPSKKLFLLSFLSSYAS